MRISRGTKIGSLAVAGVLTLAACSSSGGGTGSSSSDTSSAPPSDTTAMSPSTMPSDTSSSSSSPYAPITGDASSVKLGVALDGPLGDASFNDMAHDGEEAAKTAGVDVIEELYATTGEPDSAKQDRLQQLIDDGATTVVANGFDYATPMKAVAAANPKVHFAIVDDDSLAKVPNVASLVFSAEQSSFLAGAAAALKTTSKHVAFIGGVDVPLLQTFQAGFDAGVKAVDPSITIDDKYVEESDYAGFNEPDKGQTIAKGLYDAGADIIYAAAGGSGTGVFKAAKSESKLAIGVDSDQYTIPDLADVKSVIMTSAVKNVNIAIYNFVASVAAGSPETGVVSNDLKSGGVGISYSGGAIDDIKSKLDDFTSQIESGTITVPTTLSK